MQPRPRWHASGAPASREHGGCGRSSSAESKSSSRGSLRGGTRRGEHSSPHSFLAPAAWKPSIPSSLPPSDSSQFSQLKSQYLRLSREGIEKGNKVSTLALQLTNAKEEIQRYKQREQIQNMHVENMKQQMEKVKQEAEVRIKGKRGRKKKCSGHERQRI